MIDNYSSLYTPGIFVINTDKKIEWGILCNIWGPGKEIRNKLNIDR